MDKFKDDMTIAIAVVIIGSSILLTLPRVSSVSAKDNAQVSRACADMIQSYVGWAQKSSRNIVRAELVVPTVKSRDPAASAMFTGWAHGRMEAKGDGIEAVFQEYFSDRTDGYQPFARKKTDWLGVNISARTGVTLMLGDGKATYTDLTCPRDGFIVFKSPTPGWEAVYTIALVKTNDG